MKAFHLDGPRRYLGHGLKFAGGELVLGLETTESDSVLLYVSGKRVGDSAIQLGEKAHMITYSRRDEDGLVEAMVVLDPGGSVKVFEHDLVVFNSPKQQKLLLIGLDKWRDPEPRYQSKRDHGDRRKGGSKPQGKHRQHDGQPSRNGQLTTAKRFSVTDDTPANA
ncbi:hypothetical protein COU77_03925 [Candidatus Peregrinibacteria bacterium CG10_big_fil_rev_8_21_14_0_10_49_16]|nr:MAG: hypothetical protein COW95_04010 [Candidatus Peregrinibacteria bacterium CG22_combo_CG10-13_8_21_14_all_49_11]PIR51762.1 MAG: hypothetical protein COU77_03925 [Candidatus Peregrinibacteria bacterium CG10_big_fil_rev_8_21_14_0_10_49_16]